MNIYIVKNGQQTGPFAIEQIRAAIANGSVSPSDLAWHDGLPNWIPLSSILDKQAVVTPPPVPDATPVASKPSSPPQEPQKPQDNQPSPNDWFMQAKPTAGWKFILGMNYTKSRRLDYAERKGNMLTIAVLSGKRCTFRTGEYAIKLVKTSGDIRHFTIRSTSGDPQKIVFMENQLQMPEKWWDELTLRIGAKESGLSKALGVLSKLTGG